MPAAHASDHGEPIAVRANAFPSTDAVFRSLGAVLNNLRFRRIWVEERSLH
jgi:hypothetical protein